MDVLGVETQRAPALPRDATPAELAAFAQCPLTGGGLLRLPTDARTAHDASFAVLFATSRVALLTCADVVPDENDFVPRYVLARVIIVDTVIIQSLCLIIYTYYT